MNTQFIGPWINLHNLQINLPIYLIHVVYITRVMNLCFIKRVMLHQILLIRTTFDIVPRFYASVTYFRRFSIFNIYMCTTKNWFKMDYVKDFNNKYKGKHNWVLCKTANFISYQGSHPDDAKKKGPFGCVFIHNIFQGFYFTTSVQ